MQCFHTSAYKVVPYTVPTHSWHVKRVMWWWLDPYSLTLPPPQQSNTLHKGNPSLSLWDGTYLVLPMGMHTCTYSTVRMGKKDRTHTCVWGGGKNGSSERRRRRRKKQLQRFPALNTNTHTTIHVELGCSWDQNIFGFRHVWYLQ